MNSGDILNYSNTTLVKVKLLWLIVNIHGKMDSNTTLVKVKSIANRQNLKKPLNSNTTLVKVKLF